MLNCLICLFWERNFYRHCIIHSDLINPLPHSLAEPRLLCSFPHQNSLSCCLPMLSCPPFVQAWRHSLVLMCPSPWVWASPGDSCPLSNQQKESRLHLEEHMRKVENDDYDYSRCKTTCHFLTNQKEHNHAHDSTLWGPLQACLASLNASQTLSHVLSCTFFWTVRQAKMIVSLITRFFHYCP